MTTPADLRARADLLDAWDHYELGRDVPPALDYKDTAIMLREAATQLGDALSYLQGRNDELRRVTLDYEERTMREEMGLPSIPPWSSPERRWWRGVGVMAALTSSAIVITLIAAAVLHR